MEFYQTIMGKRYYEATLPSIARSLERIANALEELLKETSYPAKDKEEETNAD